MKRIFLFTLLTLLTMIALVPAMADRRSKLRHTPLPSVSIKIEAPEITGNCENQKITFSAAITGAASNPRWRVDSQSVEGGLDTVLAKLSPGTHTISVEVDDPVTKCTAYDSANFEAAAPCPNPIIPPPARSCFSSGSLTLSKNVETPSTGDIVTITASNTLAGGNYGASNSYWVVTGAESKGNDNPNEVKIDLTNIQPGQVVNITYFFKTELENCETKAEIAFTLPLPPTPPTPRDLTPCTSFKLNQTRVDNACKAILEGVVRQLQGEPSSIITLTGTYRKGEKASVGLQRANNIKSVLTVTGIFATVDSNRVGIQPAQSGDGAVKITYLPPGANQ